MANNIKAQKEILEKLNIFELNSMQQEAIATIEHSTNTVILSPTGTGKTLAFLLPVISLLDPKLNEVQALILVPSRELAIQIEQVIREMGSGFKVNAIYGGRSIAKDKIEMKHTPAILIGTPGRIADHFGQKRFSKQYIKTLVIDEFDKFFEVGTEEEMKFILSLLPTLNKRILTSATQGIKIPGFIRLDKPKVLDYLHEKSSKLELKTVLSKSVNKYSILLELLSHIGNHPGIIFCNTKESIDDLSAFLTRKNIAHGCFHSGMDQIERERTLIKLRNGSHSVVIASDLASRGIDIPEMKYIIHFELPKKEEDFTHRNGRTARVNAKGTAYILKGLEEELPEYVKKSKVADIKSQAEIKPPFWQTLYISGGRKDKISKGDIAGYFFKQGNISPDQLGIIELKQDCTFVAVPISIAKHLVKNLNNTKLKTKKVRVSII